MKNLRSFFSLCSIICCMFTCLHFVDISFSIFRVFCSFVSVISAECLFAYCRINVQKTFVTCKKSTSKHTNRQQQNPCKQMTGAHKPTRQHDIQVSFLFKINFLSNKICVVRSFVAFLFARNYYCIKIEPDWCSYHDGFANDSQFQSKYVTKANLNIHHEFMMRMTYYCAN